MRTTLWEDQVSEVSANCRQSSTDNPCKQAYSLRCLLDWTPID